ncbi:hypothetical protein BGZ76_003201 [Entomortierella beljakovae]|nr:hypothetical protein BGZ76_003201 [Entomortierella beljakovae]
MSSILNALRSAPSPARQFATLNVAHISVATSVKTAFHPEHHPIVLQQLVESISPKATESVASRTVDAVKHSKA